MLGFRGCWAMAGAQAMVAAANVASKPSAIFQVLFIVSYSFPHDWLEDERRAREVCTKHGISAKAFDLNQFGPKGSSSKLHAQMKHLATASGRND